MVLIAVWDLLLAGALLRPALGAGVATLAAFLLATSLVLATREPGRRRRRARRSGGTVLALAFAAGFASHPVFVAGISALGLAIGLAPRTPLGPVEGSLDLLVAEILVAPVLEEHLYRERILLALRPRVGAPAAVVGSSVLFALPHLEAWQTLGSFVVGLALGAVALRSGSVRACIALHAGLNLAAWRHA